MTLTKATLVDHLSSKCNLPKSQTKEIVELFFSEICATLVSGESVKLSGFGNFELLHKKERIGRNPKTGKEAVISARTVVSFRSGKKLKAQVNKI